MKKVFLYFAALTAVAVACRKVEIEPQEEVDPEPEVEMITETITGSRDVSTKVTIDNTSGAFAWTATNDLVAVHVSTGVYVTSAGASTSAKSATFDVTYPAGATRDAFAVFPSTIVAADAANYGQEGHTLDVTLPSSYTLAQVSGETSPCPMIATNDPGSSEWSFKQLCGLLRLTVNGIPADATGLVIQFPGNKVRGAFSISSPEPGTSTIETGAPGVGEDKITITFDTAPSSATINIPLPTGDYEDVYITPVGSSTKVAAVRHIKAGGYTARAAYAKKLTTTLVSFSVSSSRKVIMSPGNLQATYNASAETWKWGFAAHQYDRIGNAAGNTIITTVIKESSEPYAKLSGNGTVDLFGRSTAATYYGIATSNGDYYSATFKDWGNIDIDGNGVNYWFTLSRDEWCYLTGRKVSGNSNTCRNNGTVGGVANALSTKAIITEIGMKGFIIFPDNYSGLTPDGVTWSADSIQDGSYKNTEKGFATTIATLQAWEALEAEGCIFLPVVGTRVGSNIYFNYSSNEDWSCYWSSTTDGDSKVLRFNSDGFDPNNGWNKFYGEAVRLVHEL